jgi:topoisomerase-4 subunit A
MPFHGFEQIPLREYAERAYLDYSMYVVLDRALPFIGDGLKPVQRRIIYAMSELGLSAGAKPKKSARTVGDVIGKFHPHGDSACYEAMVLMAQPFSYRYPLIDGQGNFGSSDDPKSFAAMRYTESKLTPIAEVLLGELGQGTVDWDAELRRHAGRADLAAGAPAAPAAQRHHRHRGGHGHRHAAAQPQRSGQRLRAPARRSRRHRARPVRARARPGLPTEAEIITPPPTCSRCTRPATAACARAPPCTPREDGNIVITALPYQVSPSKIIEQIAQQMRAKKLPWLEDIRDESDHENPTRWCWCRAPTASMPNS